MKKVSFNKAPRKPGIVEAEILAAKYANRWNADEDDAYAVTLAGGDDPKALCLSEGDQYSQLVYEPQTDSFVWQTLTVEADDRQEYESCLHPDALDHGFHNRY